MTEGVSPAKGLGFAFATMCRVAPLLVAMMLGGRALGACLPAVQLWLQRDILLALGLDRHGQTVVAGDAAPC